jgi:hypothetical protein
MLPKNSFIGYISIHNMMIIIKRYSSVPLQTFYNLLDKKITHTPEIILQVPPPPPPPLLQCTALIYL